jgi:hypothetical protein
MMKSGVIKRKVVRVGRICSGRIRNAKRLSKK